MNEAPTVVSVLQELVGAGDEGLLSGELVRRFSYPEKLVNRNSRINTVLNNLRHRGLVERFDKKEPSLFYRHAPSYRWRITSAGLRFLRKKLARPIMPGDLEIILELAQHGANECPWAWAKDWPEGVDGDKAQEVLRLFREYIKE